MELNKKKRRLNKSNENNSNNYILNYSSKKYCSKKNENQFIVNNITIGNKSIIEYLVEFQSKLDIYYIKNKELENDIVNLKKIIKELKTNDSQSKNIEIEEIEENFSKYYIS